MYAGQIAVRGLFPKDTIQWPNACPIVDIQLSTGKGDKMNQELLQQLQPLRFPVEMRNISGIPEHMGRQLVRTDRAPATPIAIHKSRYKPISHTDAFVTSLEAIDGTGIDMDNVEMQVDSINDGAMASIEVLFKSHHMKIGDHDLYLKYVARNSYNQVWKYQSFFGWMNSVCFNTLVSGQKLSYSANRHTARFDSASAVKKIRVAAEAVLSDKPLFEKWWNTPVSDEQALDLFKKTLVKYPKTEAQIMAGEGQHNIKQLSHLTENFQSEAQQLHGSGDYGRSGASGSLWCAFQAATAWSTHCRDSIEDRSNFKLKEERERKVKSMISSTKWKELEAA